MNPQFCSVFPVRPKLVPFVIRPTAPVGYNVFYPPSPQYNINVPLVPVHLSRNATLSAATRKTRRELEQLGSPSEEWTDMIFELAAQKNGIRISTVSSKAGTVKQGNSLEDFKKIAERNGITVCQAGSNKEESVITESAVTPVSTTAPQQGIPASLSSMAIDEDKSSCGKKILNEGHPCDAETVDKGQNVSETQSNAALFEAKVEAEMNESKLTIIDVFKDKAAKCGIRVQLDISDSAGNQTDEQCSNQSERHGMVAIGDKCELSGEEMVCEPETEPAASKSGAGSVTVNSAEHSGANEDSGFETKSGDEKNGIVEMEEVEMTANNSQTSDLKESVVNDGSCEVCVAITSSESMFVAEDVSMATTSLEEDPQIVAFQNIAHKKGIKVGGVSSSTDPCDAKVIGNMEVKDLKDVDDCLEEDSQIARFQEMARLNGIKVGGNSTRKLSSNSCPEYPSVESVLAQNSNESDYYTYTAMDSEMTLLETDPQIAKFQELAWLNGIEVGNSTSSSHSSLSTANSDDYLNAAFDESYPLLMQQYLDWKGDFFEELAKRNGIKVGRKTVPKKIPAVTKAAGNESIQPLYASVFSHASTQTEVTIVVDCHSQTCEEDCGISRRTAEVQVSAMKEAFQEEYLLWKLDDNAAEDETELCYKDLYFDERQAREELSASLQNEKDVSAGVRHNHKRVMDQLKEELTGRMEECEKLKKDLKALKKHKETDIKRISKDLKSKEEELDTAKTTLHLKEAALEGLRAIAQEQTARIKGLEEQVEEMKSALSDAHRTDYCKTCLKRNTENSEDLKETGQDGQSSDDGWTVYTGKKSKNPAYKPTKNNTVQPGGISELCDIDLADPPFLHWQSAGCKKSCDSEVQSCGLSDVSCGSGTQGSQGNDSVKGAADSLVSGAHVEEEAQDEEPMNDKMTEQNVDGKAPVESHEQNVANANTKAQTLQVVEGSTVQPTSQLLYPSTFPSQPSPFPSMPPEMFAKYLSNQLQMLQQIHPPGSGTLPKSSGPVRPPPGINTQPVPEGEDPEHSSSPPPTSTGKFSSFDKLMMALQKRFPSKNRQELIVVLRKAKAGCGEAGFRGMQIPEVVKCVENMFELEEKQESQDRQTSPSAS